MKQIKFKPVGQRVLVDVIFEEKKSETVLGLYGNGFIDLANPQITEEIEQIPTDRCILLRKSSQSQLPLEEGAKLIFNQHGGTPIKIEGEIYLLLNDNDVYGQEE